MGPAWAVKNAALHRGQHVLLINNHKAKKEVDVIEEINVFSPINKGLNFLTDNNILLVNVFQKGKYHIPKRNYNTKNLKNIMCTSQISINVFKHLILLMKNVMIIMC